MSATSSPSQPALSPVMGVADEAVGDGAPSDAASMFTFIASLAGSVGDTARELEWDVDALRIDRIRMLEDAKSLICATQAELAVGLDSSQRQRQAEAGVPEPLQGRGVAAQVALARREPPHRGQALLGMAKILTTEMPHTRARLTDGTISECSAMSLVKETACLDLDHRQTIDASLCADPAALTGWGTRRIVTAARKLAQTLDPAAAVQRAAKAYRERTVTLRPAPESMVYLTALLPVAEGVACYAALTAAAATAHTVDEDTGEIHAARTRGQVLADTLVERVTGQQHAPEVPIRVNLVISDQTLLADGNEPAQLGGHMIPPPLARRIVADATHAAHGDPSRPGTDGATAAGTAGSADTDRSTHAAVRTELRRVYASPTSGQLVALEARSRIFPTALADLIDIRDRRCRTPYCDAPIRHHDHVQPHERGGPTTSSNGQGLCEACNYAKQAPNWRAQTSDSAGTGRHTVTTQTPTGHRYFSRAPALPIPMRTATSPPGRIDLARIASIMKGLGQSAPIDS